MQEEYTKCNEEYSCRCYKSPLSITTAFPKITDRTITRLSHFTPGHLSQYDSVIHDTQDVWTNRHEADTQKIFLLFCR